MSSNLDRLGRLAARRRWAFVAAWAVVLAATLGLAVTVGGEYVDDYTVPGTESQDAANILSDRFPSVGGQTGQIVFHTTSGSVQQHQQAIETSVKNVGGLPHVTTASDPFSQGSATVSKNGRTAYSSMAFNVLPQTLGSDYLDRLDRATDPARNAGLTIEYGGAAGSTGDQDEGHSEAIGIVAALLILFVGLRAAVAAGLPVLSAVISVASGLSGLALLAATSTFPTAAPALATMIGLGVGIDYSLFILTRHREHLLAGMPLYESLGRALSTAGHAVLVAGSTVVVAILGLFLAGVPLVGKLGLAAAFVVAVAVAAALTLLPALLGISGSRLLPRAARTASHVPPTRPSTHEHPHGWGAWAGKIGRRPWTFTFVGVGVLLVLAIPLTSMRLGIPDAGSDPTSDTDRRAYDLITDGFGPGFNGPLSIVLVSGKKDASTLESQAKSAGQSISGTKGVVSVGAPAVNSAGDVAALTVIPTTSPQSEATTDLVDTLRETTLPKAVSGTSLTPYVTGQTAGYLDFSARMTDRLPYLIAGVLVLAFLLLLSVFRSLTLAAEAVVLNVLSVGAAYGVVVAVFQWGWGNGLVGVDEKIPVVSYVPMMMFAIVFGLSMDYEVFLLSRIKEAYAATKDSVHSVANGLAHTAAVISSAAAIMVCVFGSFVLRSDPAIKMLGLGLAFAVLIDATVVRLLLVPATMTLLGDRNWWIPGWLDRLIPRLDVGEPAAPGASGRDQVGPPEPRPPEPEPTTVEPGRPD
ncbi:MAG: MMPL family transporter [Actinomycetes bacterium]